MVLKTQTNTWWQFILYFISLWLTRFIFRHYLLIITIHCAVIPFSKMSLPLYKCRTNLGQIRVFWTNQILSRNLKVWWFWTSVNLYTALQHKVAHIPISKHVFYKPTKTALYICTWKIMLQHIYVWCITIQFICIITTVTWITLCK